MLIWSWPFPVWLRPAATGAGAGLGRKRSRQSAQLSRQADDALGHEDRHQDEERAQNQQPHIGIGASGPAFEGVDEDRADDRADQGAAPADGDPDDGFERFVRAHFAGIDDADLRHVKNAAQGRDERRRARRQRACNSAAA